MTRLRAFFNLLKRFAAFEMRNRGGSDSMRFSTSSVVFVDIRLAACGRRRRGRASMPESHTDYWARRASEHARLAVIASHRAAVAAHNALAQAYRERANMMKEAS
jgi:hypothetical protein